MRPIKFRVWDGHEMFYGDVVEWTDGEMCYHSELDSPWEGCIINPPGALMQYTGLTDKNGKEIYEGDIVTIQTGPAPKVVKWMDSSGGAAGWNLKIPYPNSNHLEVIGNIFENPELMNKGK